MNRVVFEWGDYQLELYKALQYGSSAVFLPLLLIAGYWWLKRQQEEDVPTVLSKKTRWCWQAILIIAPLIAASVWSVGAYVFWSLSFRSFAVEAVTTLGMTQFFACSIYAAWFRMRSAPAK